MEPQNSSSLELTAVVAELKSSLVGVDFPGMIPQVCSRLERSLVGLSELPVLLPYVVEVHKQLRLIGLDLSRWQVIKQPQARSPYQQQIFQRLELLLSYCESMIEELSPLN